MTALGAVVTDLKASPLPVLVADTCSLLAVLRAPKRLNSREFRDVMSIWFELTASPPAVSVPSVA